MELSVVRLVRPKVLLFSAPLSVLPSVPKSAGKALRFVIPTRRRRPKLRVAIIARLVFRPINAKGADSLRTGTLIPRG